MREEASNVVSSLEPELRHEFQADPLRDLAAQEALVLFEMLDHVARLAAAKRHHVDGRELEVGRHAHLRHGERMALDHLVHHLAARKDLGKRMADQFAHLQLALAWRTVRLCLASWSSRLSLVDRSSSDGEPKCSLWPSMTRYAQSVRWTCSTWKHSITSPCAHVLIALERHAAFLAGHHFFDFVLEALERRQLAFVDHDIVADQADMRAALDLAFGHAAAGDLADLGDVEHLQDLGIAEEGLAPRRRKQARHGCFMSSTRS